MKKSFKILSCLAVAVVAFIISFSLVNVYGADDEPIFTYTLEDELIISQDSPIELNVYFLNASQYDDEYLGSQSELIVKTNQDNVYNLDLTGKKYTSFNIDLLTYIYSTDEYIVEIVSYAFYTPNDDILLVYPETIPEEGGETMSGFITQVFETLGDIIEGFSSTLVSLFENVVKIFYTAPTGSETVGSLTVVGVLTLVAMGCGLVIWGFKFLRSLIRVKTK